MKEREIDFIYFDIGNVLLLFSSGLQKLATKHHLSYDEFETVFRKYDDAVCRGKMSPQDLWKKYEEELGISENNFDFATYWTSCFTLIEETFVLIDELVKCGTPIGLLSNIYNGIFDILSAKNFFPNKNWNAIVLSSEVGFAKPEPEIYQVAEKKAKTMASKILFIDDKKEFLETAKQRGWQTFLFDHSDPSRSVEALRKVLVKKKVLT